MENPFFIPMSAYLKTVPIKPRIPGLPWKYQPDECKGGWNIGLPREPHFADYKRKEGS